MFPLCQIVSCSLCLMEMLAHGRAPRPDNSWACQAYRPNDTFTSLPAHSYRCRSVTTHTLHPLPPLRTCLQPRRALPPPTAPHRWPRRAPSPASEQCWTTAVAEQRRSWRSRSNRRESGQQSRHGIIARGATG